MSEVETAPQTINGVNVTAILGAREALEKAPEAAEFVWMATSEWVGGVQTRTTVNKFFGLGQDHVRSKTFKLDTDHPEVFAAPDAAPTPVEMVLAGLAGGRSRIQGLAPGQDVRSTLFCLETLGARISFVRGRHGEPGKHERNEDATHRAGGHRRGSRRRPPASGR